MNHMPVSAVCGVELSPPAESSVKRLLLFSKGLFGTPKCGTEEYGGCARWRDSLPAAKQLPVFGIGIATTAGGILCTLILAWGDSGNDGASHGPPV